MTNAVYLRSDSDKQRWKALKADIRAVHAPKPTLRKVHFPKEWRDDSDISERINSFTGKPGTRPFIFIKKDQQDSWDALKADLQAAYSSARGSRIVDIETWEETTAPNSRGGCRDGTFRPCKKLTLTFPAWDPSIPQNTRIYADTPD